jgi:peptidoglycan/xylan/chitin deacetylase (PgdA/CDA1 family)
MPLSDPAIDEFVRRAQQAPLAPSARPADVAKSRALRSAAARALPSRVFVTRGPRRGPPRVALTFDDGPDEMTPKYLDALDALGVRATFFLVGEYAAERRDTVLEYIRRGHEVAGHGWTHRPLPTLRAAELIDELARTADVLPAPATPRPLVRPPNGRLDAATLLRVAAAGYTTVLWSLDSNDCRTRETREIAKQVSAPRLRAGDIVLMHEAQPWTLEALPAVVAGAQAAGFSFVTVGEMLGFGA